MCDILQIQVNDVMTKVTWDVKDWKDVSNLSAFDNKLLTKWANAVKNGYFRYKLNIQGSAVVPGKWRFFKELNVERGESRRKPQEFYSVNQPFNAALFNFTRIRDEEILFQIKMNEALGNSESQVNDYIAINVSPLCEGHCLILPCVEKMHPQALTQYSIEMTLCLLLQSSSPTLRIAFNSLCGAASVNHLHLHCLYVTKPMILEYLDLEVFEGPCYQMVNYPARGFVFQGSADSPDDLKSVARNVFKLTSFLHSQNEAHNVTMTRSKLSESDKYLAYFRVYVWVRKPVVGAKVMSGFNPAALELFGYFTFKNEELYKNAEEKFLCDVLEDMTHEPFERNYEKIKQLFG
ncbi:GDP-D-glucose phosphorylase 1 [Frankliniella fusca]|uniref:GDP-D-glucose phosphorylase 1 n=1 Tax=Frankliniella fusca TaxID=407009 RepID=A0AAE1GSK4_9NEOP|nr:GDP-D-glucose phosphorylase 1 [Frankliniella fusca]